MPPEAVGFGARVAETGVPTRTEMRQKWPFWHRPFWRHSLYPLDYPQYFARYQDALMVNSIVDCP